MKTVVFGLGSMGYGIATSLLRAGIGVHGFDVSNDAATRFRADGGANGAIEDVASALDAAVIVVLNADQLGDVLFGPNGVVPQLASETVVMACVTVPPAFAAQMAERCAEHGVHYLDAPISGGAARAAEGTLSIMASGTPEAFEAAAPLLDAMAETVFSMGERAGAGSAMKAVNQMLAGTHIAAMAEAMVFAATQGIAPARVMEVIPRCAGTSWMLENRGPHVVNDDYTPRSSVDIWPKDLGIVLDAARASGFDAPLARAALERFQAASAAGLGHEDDAALTKHYASEAGVDLSVGLDLPGKA